MLNRELGPIDLVDVQREARRYLEEETYALGSGVTLLLNILWINVLFASFDKVVFVNRSAILFFPSIHPTRIVPAACASLTL